MTHGERRLISIQCQKECLENKLDGQTDSHSDNSSHLLIELLLGLPNPLMPTLIKLTNQF